MNTEGMLEVDMVIDTRCTFMYVMREVVKDRKDKQLKENALHPKSTLVGQSNMLRQKFPPKLSSSSPGTSTGAKKTNLRLGLFVRWDKTSSEKTFKSSGKLPATTNSWEISLGVEPCIKKPLVYSLFNMFLNTREMHLN